MTHRAIKLIFLGFLGGFAAVALANAPIVPLDELTPQAEHRRATRLITHVIANYHYRNTALDDDLSRVVLDRYIEALDPTRSYFLQSDIDDFQQHATRVDDYLRSSSLNPLFEMFVRFRERLRERTDFAVAALAENFDFTARDSIDFDRENAPWPTSATELDELWRKRVKNDVLSLHLAGKKDAELKETLRKRYTGLLRRTAQLNSEDVFQTLINAYTTAIDPHTAYFSPRTSENFKIRMSLSLEGIGAVLQSENEMTLVREVVAGGPAALSGKLHANDRIVGIGQDEKGPVVDVVGWRLDDVVDLIRGPKNSVVRLQILPKGVGLDGPTSIIAITRNTIQLDDQAVKGSVIDEPSANGTMHIGVINVPTFYMDFEARSAGDENYRSTTRDVRKIITDLQRQKISGLVIDLRGNGGGSLSEATELTGLFIDQGPVVQVRDSQGRVQIERDVDAGVAYDGPLLVLIDRNSASASEIFAGAIQDYGRGVLVGEPSFGKGTVQNLVDLNRFDQSMEGKLGQLKATIAQFFRVSGSSTQFRGVTPEIIMPTVVSVDDQGERSLDHALPWASIEAASYAPRTLPKETLVTVKREHERRIEKDDAFKAIVAMETAIKEARDKKQLSLNEAERRKEHDTARAEQRARENRVRVARGLKPLSADFDLELDAEGEVIEAPKLDEAEERALDVVLNEAGHILSDWVDARSTDKRLVVNEAVAKPSAGPPAATSAGTVEQMR